MHQVIKLIGDLPRKGFLYIMFKLCERSYFSTGVEWQIVDYRSDRARRAVIRLG